MAIGTVSTAWAADEEKSITQRLVEADAKLALQKLEADVNKNGTAATLSAAPAGADTQKKAEDHKPKTIAVYGVDGSAAGLPIMLRSYVKWDDEIYPAKVGTTWRGYRVASISSEEGTLLVRGKERLIAPVVRNDARVFARTTPTGTEATTAQRPAGPLPPQAGAMQSSTFMPVGPMGGPAPAPFQAQTPPPGPAAH